MLDPRRAQQIFEQALQLSADERDAFLLQMCGKDHELLAEVRSLLKHASDTLDDDVTPTLDSEIHQSGSDDLVGKTVAGRYVLREKIGEGGFGVVYLADQIKPVRRCVAVKIIKLGMDSRAIVARFEAERQSLAMMDHPGIARIIDGGTTSGPLDWARLDRDGDGMISRDEWIAAMKEIDRNDDGEITAAEWQAATNRGRPYFVMEYVEGTPISEFCDQHQLRIKERIRLFQQVCSAVQHAHAKGIIHRDLKPSNILVSESSDGPRITVIDFGIAKALEARVEDASFFTEAGHLVGTPEYMSPEQFNIGTLDIDIRSDVYALGVLLYELLSGRLPFNRDELRKSGLAGIQRIVQEVDPPRPSTRYEELRSSQFDTSTSIAAARSIPPTTLRKRLRGDLDWIIMRCIEKDRDRRYDTAAAFSADLQRYLVHEPVEAGPPSAGYRLRKFAKRRAGLLASLSAIFLFMAAGITVSALSNVEARHQRDLALEQRDVAEEERAKAQEEKERAEAVKDFLSNMLMAARPSTAGSMDNQLLVYILDYSSEQLDDTFSNQPELKADLHSIISSTYQSLGLFEQAVPHQSKALVTRRRVLGDEHPDTLLSINNMGLALSNQGKYEEAEAYYREALDAQRRVLGDEHPDTLTSINNMGVLLSNQGKYEEAEAYYREALDARRRLLGDEHPDTLASINNMGLLLNNQGKYEEAEAYYREALDAQRRVLGDEHPGTLTSINNMGLLLNNQGKYEEAEAYYREALDASRRVLGDEHPYTLTSISNMGVLLNNQGKYEEAEAHHREALDARRRLLGDEHPDTLSSINNMGSVLSDQGKYEEAEAYYREALDASRRVLGDEHPYTLTSISNMGVLLNNQGKYEEAEAHHREALDARRRLLGDEHPDTLKSINNMGLLLNNQGKYEEAEAYYREDLDARRRIFGNEHPDTLSSIDSMSLLLENQGKYEESEAYYREALDARRRLLGDKHPDTLYSYWAIADMLLTSGNYVEAEKMAAHCYPLYQEVYGGEHQETLYVVELLATLYEEWGKPDQAKKYRDMLPVEPAEETEQDQLVEQPVPSDG